MTGHSTQTNTVPKGHAMQHPIHPLTDDGLDLLHERLADIRNALEDLQLEPQRGEAPVMERIERMVPGSLFEELRAYLSLIGSSQMVICDLLYGDPVLLANEGLIAIPAEVQNHAVALAEMVLASASSVSDDSFGHYMAQFKRGVITTDEFEALVAVYWDQRGLAEATDVERCDWLYDHDQMDAQAYWEALEEAWTEHQAGIAYGSHADCDLCVWDTAAEFRNAHLTARFPQMTGAPATSEGEVG
jgi:hypothetical protein